MSAKLDLKLCLGNCRSIQCTSIFAFFEKHHKMFVFYYSLQELILLWNQFLCKNCDEHCYQQRLCKLCLMTTFYYSSFFHNHTVLFFFPSVIIYCLNCGISCYRCKLTKKYVLYYLWLIEFCNHLTYCNFLIKNF